MIKKQDKQIMYNERSKYYDLIYHWKDYEKESNDVIKLIKKYKKSKGNSLLELGCGSGKHLQHFKDKFNCIGSDINLGILKEAKKNVKNVEFKQVDMINFNLNKKFDVVLSLFSSIGYVKTKSNLKKTFKQISKHLEVGGVVIIEGWFSKKEFTKGNIMLHTYEDDEIKICRMNYSQVKNNVSILNFSWMIAERNKGIEYFKDVHELGLFDEDEYLNAMEQSGLKSFRIKTNSLKERNLYVGIKE